MVVSWAGAILRFTAGSSSKPTMPSGGEALLMGLTDIVGSSWNDEHQIRTFSGLC